MFRHRTKPLFDVSLYLNGIIINRVPKCRFLGVWVNWSGHICYVLSKITKNKGIISKIIFYWQKDCTFVILCAYLSHCNIVWASNYTSRLNSLKYHKNGLFVSSLIFLPRHPPSHPFANSILNIYQINDFLTAIFMFRYANNLLPHSFKNFFYTFIRYSFLWFAFFGQI